MMQMHGSQLHSASSANLLLLYPHLMTERELRFTNAFSGFEELRDLVLERTLSGP